MNTLHHGYWTYFFARKKKKLVKYAIIGGIAPDLIYFAMFIYLSFSENLYSIITSENRSSSFHRFIHLLFEHPVGSLMRQMGHSIFIWSVVFAGIVLLKGFKLNKWTAFLYGWLGHIIVDFLTHANDAIPIFYPVHPYVFHSPISYWDSRHDGDIFSIVNYLLMGSSIVYLLIQKKRRKFDKTNKGKEEIGNYF